MYWVRGRTGHEPSRCHHSALDCGLKQYRTTTCPGCLTVTPQDGKADSEAVRAGAREVADALLSRALELQGAADEPPQPEAADAAAGSLSPSDELFRCLLALHVLCLADVKLLHKASDPQRAVRCLAPYIKVRQLAGACACDATELSLGFADTVLPPL